MTSKENQKNFLKVLTQISKFGILLVSREERADKKRPKKFLKKIKKCLTRKTK